MKRSVSSLWNAYFAHYAGLTRETWALISIAFVVYLAIGVHYYLSIYFSNVLHFKLTTIGIIISCYGFGTVLGGILGGKLTDKFGPLRVSNISLWIQIVAYFVLTLLKTPEAFMVWIWILGVAFYIFKTANSTWILESSQESEAAKLKAINILYTAANLGAGISAAIISGLMAYYNFKVVLYISAFTHLGIRIYLMFKRNRTDSPTFSEMSPQEAIPQETKATIESPKDAKKITYLTLGCLFLYGLVVAQLSVSYALYVHDLFPELGIKAVGILFTLNPILIIFLQTPLVNKVGEYNKIIVLGVGAFLYGFGMFLLAFSFSFWMAVVSCIVYTAGEMIFFAVAQLLCYQKAEKKKKALSLGLYQTVFASSIMIGPVLGGWVYHHLGGVWVWYFSGILGSVCLGACLAYHYWRENSMRLTVSYDD